MNNRYSGMTVNERLYVSGFMDMFDSAVKEKNIKEIVIILKKIELTDQSITAILKDLGLGSCPQWGQCLKIGQCIKAVGNFITN